MNARAPIPAVVSGPGVDRTMPDGAGAAVSFAITCATVSNEPGTWYVRENDEVVARVEKLAGGQILIFGSAMIAAERRKEEERTPFVPSA